MQEPVAQQGFTITIAVPATRAQWVRIEPVTAVEARIYYFTEVSHNVAGKEQLRNTRDLV